ncbi:MAG: amidohydrolase [Candidatus Latescibacterota bacterium]|nr:MAG: amidohydrolase [Candidatus Latescibacterota bacterium]
MKTVPEKLQGLFPAALRDTLLELRHDLHRHPELSFREERTAVRLERALAELAPLALERVAGTGVVARIAGRDPRAPVVALRGDIDALPIAEQTGKEHASQNPGVMHACGHDVHATWVVGAGHLLRNDPAGGDVLLLLQPAEESGRGAPAVLETGALDDARAIFGAHVDGALAVGQVIAETGPIAAAADLFTIELRGRGAHAARPHEAADPVVGLAALVTSLQSIVSRRVEPGRAAVVTVARLRAGSAPNVIPDEASLSGTLRASDAETRRRIQEQIGAIAAHTASAYGLEARVQVEAGTPALVNQPQPIGWCRAAVERLLGVEALRTLAAPNMAAEDFGFYLERMPGGFLRVGARDPATQAAPAHTSRFYAADAAIFVGAAILAETARVASDALGQAHP